MKWCRFVNFAKDRRFCALDSAALTAEHKAQNCTQQFCGFILRSQTAELKGAEMHLTVLRPLNAKSKGAEKRTESMNSDPYSAALFLRPWPQIRAQIAPDGAS